MDLIKFKGKWIVCRRFLHYPICLSVMFHVTLLLGFINLLIVAVVQVCVHPSELVSTYQRMMQNFTVSNKNDTSSDNNFRNFPDYTMLFVYYVFIYLVPTDLLLFILYKILKWFRQIPIKSEYKLNMERISALSKRRTTFLNISTLYKTFYGEQGNEIRTYRRTAVDAGLYVSNLLFEEHPDVLLGLNHPNLDINPLEGVFTVHRRYYDLKEFMFLNTWEKIPSSLPPLTDIVIYIKDILEGLQYLHDHQIYHLNICPENIWIVVCPNRHSGIAKIIGFDFAVKTDQRIVDYHKVGLEWTYR